MSINPVEKFEWKRRELLPGKSADLPGQFDLNKNITKEGKIIYLFE